MLMSILGIRKTRPSRNFNYVAYFWSFHITPQKPGKFTRFNNSAPRFFASS